MQRAKEEEHGARRGLLLHQQLGEEDSRDCLSRFEGRGQIVVEGCKQTLQRHRVDHTGVDGHLAG